jgi:hypothetical protein
LMPENDSLSRVQPQIMVFSDMLVLEPSVTMLLNKSSGSYTT